MGRSCILDSHPGRWMPAAVRMPHCHSRRFKCERPIGAATGNRANHQGLVPNPPPPPTSRGTPPQNTSKCWDWQHQLANQLRLYGLQPPPPPTPTHPQTSHPKTQHRTRGRVDLLQELPRPMEAKQGRPGGFFPDEGAGPSDIRDMSTQGNDILCKWCWAVVKREESSFAKGHLKISKHKTAKEQLPLAPPPPFRCTGAEC